MYVLKRVTKHRLGKYPCQTAVLHLLTASACHTAERNDPSVAALLNTIDLERRGEHDTYAQSRFNRDDYDSDGVLLVGPGTSADDDMVREPLMLPNLYV
jgi:hypothetical protein